MNKNTKQEGFTIIEVVLVLAIAALIFLMIFIALPALQRGQRDTARKNDANSVASALNSYRGNSRGDLPDDGEFADFVDEYVVGGSNRLNQYDAEDITLETGDLEEAEPDNVDTMTVVTGVDCDGNDSSRAAAVQIMLEASNAVVCTDA